MTHSETHVVFVSGLSGSGKSTAMAALEDVSFYCVDNLPAQLVEQFLELCAKATPPIEKIALAVDAREKPFLDRVPEVVALLREEGSRVEVMFLDCANEVLESRYQETRRVHPLSPTGSVEEGIERERVLLEEVARLADHRIDTSLLNVHQLKQAAIRCVSGRTRLTVVNMVSCGFRHGTPGTLELLFDVRFLPNPHFERELRPRTGLDPDVASYVLESRRGRQLMERLEDLISYLLPLYDQEGRAYLTIGVGCTGGRHRSVAVVSALAERLQKQGREVNLEHRDVGREP
jgi:UPF0042 nucleotide-binding protein